LSAAITLPMSFTLCAPVVLITSAIAAFASVSDICCGMNALMISISARSRSANSLRPPLS